MRLLVLLAFLWCISARTPIVYFYRKTGSSKLPTYLTTTTHVASELSGEPVVFICDRAEHEKSGDLGTGLDIVYIDTLDCPHRDNFDKFAHSTLTHGTAWFGGYERIFYLHALMEVRNYSRIVHLEGDVLVYSNFSALGDTMHEIYGKSLATTPGGRSLTIVSVLYVGSSDALLDLIERANLWVQKSPENVRSVTRLAGAYMSTQDRGYYSEMTFFTVYHNLFPGRLNWLPTQPYGPYSEHLERFGGVFDPAAYGRLCGQGWASTLHYIGNDIFKNGTVVAFGNVPERSGVAPYTVRKDGSVTRVHNFHVASKDPWKLSPDDTDLLQHICFRKYLANSSCPQLSSGMIKIDASKQLGKRILIYGSRRVGSTYLYNIVQNILRARNLTVAVGWANPCTDPQVYCVAKSHPDVRDGNYDWRVCGHRDPREIVSSLLKGDVHQNVNSAINLTKNEIALQINGGCDFDYDYFLMRGCKFELVAKLMRKAFGIEIDSAELGAAEQKMAEERENEKSSKYGNGAKTLLFENHETNTTVECAPYEDRLYRETRGYYSYYNIAYQPLCA